MDLTLCSIQPEYNVELNSTLNSPFIVKKNKEKLPEDFTELLEFNGKIIPIKYKDVCFEAFDLIMKE